MYKLPDTQIRREAGGDSLRAAGQQIHPIADRRCVVRAAHSFAELAAVTCGSPK